MVVHPGAAFSVQDVFTGWVRGLHANGVETGAYSIVTRADFFREARIPRDDGTWWSPFTPDDAWQLALDGLPAELWKHHPVDVVLIVSGFYVPVDLMRMIRARGIKVVLLFTESPYEDDTQVSRAHEADLVLVNDPTNLDVFRAVNPNSHYQWHCYDPAIHSPGPTLPDHASDFCFVGTGFPSRIRFLEAVDWTAIDVALAGMWETLDANSPLRQYVAHPIDECCANTTTVDLYRGTRLSANLYRQESERPELATGWAMGPREVELAAIGTPFLREPRPEGDALFPFLPRFTDPTEFGDLVRWHLARPDVLAALGAQASAAVHDRTFANSAARMLQLLNL